MRTLRKAQSHQPLLWQTIFDREQGYYCYLKDVLGTKGGFMIATASKVQSYVYSAFGKIVAIKDAIGNDVTAAPIITPYFTYTGREFDQESGLYHYRARGYDPRVGRFLQIDPFDGAQTDPITMINKYVYTANNPILYVDPSGEFFSFLSNVLPGGEGTIGDIKISAKDVINMMNAVAFVGAIPGNALLALTMDGDYISNFLELQGRPDQSGELNQDTIAFFGKEGLKNSLPKVYYPLAALYVGYRIYENRDTVERRLEKAPDRLCRLLSFNKCPFD